MRRRFFEAAVRLHREGSQPVEKMGLRDQLYICYVIKHAIGWRWKDDKMDLRDRRGIVDLTRKGFERPT